MFSLFSTLLNAFVQLNNKCYKVIQLIKGSHMIEIKFCFHNSWILWVCSKYSNFLCDKQKIWVFISVLKWINLANRDRQYSPRCSLLLVSVLSVFRLAAYSHSARRSVFPTSVVRMINRSYFIPFFDKINSADGIISGKSVTFGVCNQ